MRTRMGFFAVHSLAVAGALGFYVDTFGQAPMPPGDTVTREEFERRLHEIDMKYRDELKQRDDAIADLKSELSKRPPTHDQVLAEQRADMNDAQLKTMLEQIDSDAARESTKRTAVSFNPDIAVVLDFFGSLSDNQSNKAWNRFDVREAELDIRAAVHPRADAVVILAFARDVENPVFPNGEPLEGPDTSVELEEGYLFLHDFGVPNLTAKLGRFHVRFGRQNILHLHDLPTSDPPLVNQAFLAPEALTDSGVSLSYLVPNPWNQYFEAVFEVLSGEGAGAESPTLQGDLNVDSPAFNTHLLWNSDIGENWNLELGGSWLTGWADSDNNRRTNLFGGDLTLIYSDPTGGFNNFLFQAEFIRGLIDQKDDFTSRAWGAYVLAQQQLHKDWYVGARLDWTQNPFDATQDVWGVSPYVSWYWSEFLRFRIEYQHEWGDVNDQDVVMFQVTWIFGAHPPHPYWAMR